MMMLTHAVTGRFNSKMIKKATFGSTYFDELGTFESVEVDKLSGNVRRPSFLPFSVSLSKHRPTNARTLLPAARG